MQRVGVDYASATLWVVGEPDGVERLAPPVARLGASTAQRWGEHLAGGAGVRYNGINFRFVRVGHA